MKGYKAFEPGLVCRGKQYLENTTFEEPDAKICKSGMHFCKNPLDVLSYYDLVREDGSLNEIAEVEALAECNTDDNKKFCTTKLHIGAKLSLGNFVNACVDFLIEKAIGASSGSDAQIASSGSAAKIASSGSAAQIASSGSAAKIASSGSAAQIASSGSDAQIASSGYSAQIASSGSDAQIASSGSAAQIASSGSAAQIASSGSAAQIDCTGEDSVICCAGHNSKAKAQRGCWITLAEWKYDADKNRIFPVCVKTEYVDGERIKEGVFYTLKNGEFVECQED